VEETGVPGENHCPATNIITIGQSAKTITTKNKLVSHEVLYVKNH
jgi:hypothetical protein